LAKAWSYKNAGICVNCQTLTQEDSKRAPKFPEKNVNVIFFRNIFKRGRERKKPKLF